MRVDRMRKESLSLASSKLVSFLYSLSEPKDRIVNFAELAKPASSNNPHKSA
jgi:hypothetical protein